MKKKLAHARSGATPDERLRSHGLKKTAARVHVLRYLEGHRGPPAPTHGEASDAIARLDLGIDRATVYRVLLDFVHAGLARRIDLGDRVFRFELRDDDADEIGPSFSCETCGAAFELPDGAVTLHKVRGAPRALERARVYVRGICDDCARKSPS